VRRDKYKAVREKSEKLRTGYKDYKINRAFEIRNRKTAIALKISGNTRRN
jgi:hypothetical protein